MTAAPTPPTLADDAQRGSHCVQRMGMPSSPRPYYDEDGITIYCGDNREILPLLEGADLLLTDPPYGLDHGRPGKAETRGLKPNGKWKAARRVKDYGRCEWDSELAPDWMLSLALEKTDNAIIWGGNYYSLPPSSCWLVWDKLNGENDFADCELAWTNLPKAVRRIQYLWDGFRKAKPEQREHPTQKPLEVMSWCLNHAPEAKTILDPWMGSGTTLVAAKERGLRAVGIEANETYCKLAVSRLAQGVLWRHTVGISDPAQKTP